MHLGIYHDERDETRLIDSAIGTAGAGFGAQIGAQLTDCVFILNTADAVRAFSHGGNVTLVPFPL